MTATTASWMPIKRVLLLFWALWLSVVVATNVTDLLKTLGMLPADFAFASGNYGAIVKVVEPFGITPETAKVLFMGVIAWEAICALLFWALALTFQGIAAGRTRLLKTTFAFSLGLWGAFQIACELFPSLLSFQIESTHRSLLTAQIATLLAIVFLPESAPSITEVSHDRK